MHGPVPSTNPCKSENEASITKAFMPCILSKPSSLTTATSVVIGRSSSPSFNTICRAICNSTLVSDLSALGDCGYSSGPVPRTACPRRRLGPVSRTARLVSGSVPRTAQPRRCLGPVSRTVHLVSGSVPRTAQPRRRLGPVSRTARLVSGLVPRTTQPHHRHRLGRCHAPRTSSPARCHAPYSHVVTSARCHAPRASSPARCHAPHSHVVASAWCHAPRASSPARCHTPYSLAASSSVSHRTASLPWLGVTHRTASPTSHVLIRGSLETALSPASPYTCMQPRALRYGWSAAAP